MTARSESSWRDAFRLTWEAATDVGRVRSANEDALLARPPVFLVADGMGGHQRGAEASAGVVKAFEVLTEAPWVHAPALSSVIATATEHVVSLGETTASAPGSTLTGVGLSWHDSVPSWLVFNVGDSRVYKCAGGVTEQVTVDHSRFQDLLDAGVPAAEAGRRASRNLITRAVGGGGRSTPTADKWLIPAQTGDRLLLCSDGLTGEVTDQLISAILASSSTAREAAHALLDAALAAGGRDNVTVIVIDALAVTGAEDALPRDDDTRPDVAAIDPEDTVDSDVVPEDLSAGAAAPEKAGTP